MNGSRSERSERKREPTAVAHCDGGIAQLGEHLLCKQWVNGSIPFISTKVFLKKNKEAESKDLKAGDIWAYSSAG